MLVGALALAHAGCIELGCQSHEDCDRAAGYYCPLAGGLCVPEGVLPRPEAGPDIPMDADSGDMLPDPDVSDTPLPDDGPLDEADMPDMPPPPEVCNGQDDDGDGVVDEGVQNRCGGCDELPEVCDIGDIELVPACAGAGQVVCNPDSPGSTICVARQPLDTAEDECDGLDNDCDRLIDEGTMLDAPAGLPGVCSHLTQICDRMSGQPRAPIGDELLGVPNYEVAEETCDNLDNDCDGEVDEFASERRPLAERANQGVCGEVRQICCNGSDPCPEEVIGFQEPPLEGHPQSYAAQVGDAFAPSEAAAEFACDGRDNDCDGTRDVADDEVTEPRASWFEARPLCREARQVCDRVGGVWGFRDPEGAALAAQRDRFDPRFTPGDDFTCGDDNDCDGVVDENAAAGWAHPLGDRINELHGICRRAMARCVGGELVLPESLDDFRAQMIAREGNVERSCDGLDNDCDGDMDEADDFAMTAGLAGLPGVCAELRAVCAPDEDGVLGFGPPPEAEWAARVGMTYEPDETRCDGLDNDCDASTDENVGRPCWAEGVDPEIAERADGDRFPCTSGTQACTGPGEYGACMRGGQPVVDPAEVDACHTGVDENCDGVIDEGCLDGPCSGNGHCPNVPGGAWCDPTAGGRCGMGGPMNRGCRCWACYSCLAFGNNCEEPCQQCKMRAPTCGAMGGRCAFIRDLQGELDAPCGQAGQPDCFDRCLTPCDHDSTCRPGWTCQDGHADFVLRELDQALDDLDDFETSNDKRFCRPAP